MKYMAVYQGTDPIVPMDADLVYSALEEKGYEIKNDALVISSSEIYITLFSETAINENHMTVETPKGIWKLKQIPE